MGVVHWWGQRQGPRDPAVAGGPPDAAVLERRVWRWRVGASLYAAVTRVGYFVLWVVPGQVIDLRLGDTGPARMVLTSTGLAVVLTPLGRAHARRQFEPVARWLRSGSRRRPTTRRRSSTSLANTR